MALVTGSHMDFEPFACDILLTTCRSHCALDWNAHKEAPTERCNLACLGMDRVLREIQGQLFVAFW